MLLKIVSVQDCTNTVSVNTFFDWQ